MQSARTLPRALWLVALLLVCVACGAGARVARHPAPPASGRVRPLSAETVPERVRALSAASTAGQPVDPSAFSPGACIAFSPTSPSRHLTVFLDAGHGGRDPGAVGSTESGHPVNEANVTLPVELRAMSMLRAAGLRVVVSRTRETSVRRLRPGDVSGRGLTIQGSHADVLARDVCANDGHANVLIGIYFNAGAVSNAGCLTGYDAVRPFAAENLRLAKLVQADVVAAMNANGWGIPNDGVQPDAGLGSVLSRQALAYGHLVLLGPAYHWYVPTPSRMPGVLIEPLFITDPFEGSIAASRHGQEVIAGGLVRAIEQYFASGE